MNANPHSCAHIYMTVDQIAGGRPFIRCMDCDTTWDADEPLPDHGDELDTWENHPEWEEHHTRVCTHSKVTDWYAHEPPLAFCKQCGWWYNPTILNPDNELTSEHQQWRKDNDDA